MADATYTISASGANKVEREMKRAENAMNKTKGASMKGGMAMLDFSRGFEDFAVAGMRGAMNNIPTVMSNLGVGAGLTGVLAMATVAVWKGVEALDAYLLKMDELHLAKYEQGGRVTLDPDSLGATFNEEAVKLAQKMTEAMEAMAVANDMLAHQAGISEREKAMERELSNLYEMGKLTARGASDEEKRIALMNQAIAAEKDNAAAARDTVKARQESLEKLEAAKKTQEETIGKVSADKIAPIQAKMNEVYMEEIRKGWKRKDQINVATEAREASIRRTAPMMEKAFGSQGGYENAVKEREVAKENLKIIEKQIAAQTLLLTKETASADSAEKISKLKEDYLRTTEDIAAIEENTKRLEKERKDRQTEISHMMSRSNDVSGMLSSQGQSGLAGNEVRTAMDTLNIFKQSLHFLKQIERNTGRRTFSYA